ncbi:MAG TPA: hypothetical protein VFG04_08720 [Planctomycetaceae bacterium]|jgi:hypothetical protein|nr:hypothetical protein [Planctomycetaceae bacterium]
MHYSFRPYLIGRKRTCRLTDRGIEIDDGTKESDFVPYSEIRFLNLRYNGFIPGAGSYRCVVATDRRTLAIPSSKPSTEKLDGELQTYRDFVTNLHQRLVPLEDRIRFTRGSTGLYIASMVLSTLLLAFLAFAAFLVLIKGAPIRIRTGVKFVALGSLFFACLFPMIQRGKTASYAPEEIPMDLLPESAAVLVPAPQ